jgi:hypothetical protein
MASRGTAPQNYADRFEESAVWSEIVLLEFAADIGFSGIPSELKPDECIKHHAESKLEPVHQEPPNTFKNSSDEDKQLAVPQDAVTPHRKNRPQKNECEKQRARDISTTISLLRKQVQALNPGMDCSCKLSTLQSALSLLQTAEISQPSCTKRCSDSEQDDLDASLKVGAKKLRSAVEEGPSSPPDL